MRKVSCLQHCRLPSAKLFDITAVPQFDFHLYQISDDTTPDIPKFSVRSDNFIIVNSTVPVGRHGNFTYLTGDITGAFKHTILPGG